MCRNTHHDNATWRPSYYTKWSARNTYTPWQEKECLCLSPENHQPRRAVFWLGWPHHLLYGGLLCDVTMRHLYISMKDWFLYRILLVYDFWLTTLSIMRWIRELTGDIWDPLGTYRESACSFQSLLTSLCRGTRDIIVVPFPWRSAPIATIHDVTSR